MIFATLILLAFFPAAHYYRYAMEVGGLLGREPTEVVSEALQNLDVRRELGGEGAVSAVLLTRLSLLEPVSASMRLIDNGEWKSMRGRSYLDALISLVPRIAWPDKPDFHYGTDFGQAAGILGPLDWTTSISVTFPGEAYLNFGWSGAAVMLFMAFAFSSIYYQSRTSSAWLLCYFVALPTLLYIGGTFALYVGGLLKLMLLFGAVAVWLQAPHHRPTLQPYPHRQPS
jgi:hypothetical protein